VRTTYEALAATAGLRIMFDSRLQGDGTVSFKIQNVDIVDALDFLSLQSRTIWEMMGRDTVLVMPDNQTARADLLPKVTKTISVSTSSITNLVTALRTVLNLRQLSTLDNSIVITDTAENIVFAEKMLKELNAPAVR
jgi:type II secretory pathway component GspD/PulD (secretin)